MKQSSLTATPGGRVATSLALLGGFRLMDGRGKKIQLSRGAQRLIAFLALRGGVVTRARIAGELWPEATEQRAMASLRTELWRLKVVVPDVVGAGAQDLSLLPTMLVDLYEAKALATRLVSFACPLTEADLEPTFTCALFEELLPGWYEDWAVMASETWSQLRLHALEALAATQMERGHSAQALGTALEAVSAEPLRESANILVIRFHLAEGNQSEALRAFRSYKALLHRELGLEPTVQFASLLSSLVGA